MLGKPLGQLFSGDEAGGKVEHEALLLIYDRDDLGAVQHQERLHTGARRDRAELREAHCRSRTGTPRPIATDAREMRHAARIDKRLANIRMQPTRRVSRDGARMIR